MQTLDVGNDFALNWWTRLRVRGVRAPVILALLGSATIAITSATALTSGASSVAPAVPRQQQATMAYPGTTAASARAMRADAAAEFGTQRFAGRIGEDLTRSLQRAGVPERQGREYVAVLARAIDLAGGLSVEDRFDLVVERAPDGRFDRLLYVGLDRVARADVSLLKWTDGKSLIWVNADGVGGENNAGMRMPVSGGVSSGFGNRFHPILGHARFHKGVDLRATYGAPIVAAADGRVVGAGWHGGYGRQVAIAHGGGIQTTYSHMSRMAASPGQMVRRGQVIGYVGSSGLSTGPHVHYEVYKNGRPVNPMSVKLATGPGHLEGEKLHAFQDELRKLLLAPTAG